MNRAPAAFRAALFLRRRLPALLLLAAGANAGAGSFNVSPILAEVPRGESSATYTLRNTGEQPLTVQVSAKHWLQRDNNNLHVDNRTLLVVPPLATIEPGGTQIVRVALRKERPAHELAYRIYFHEVPPAPPEGFVGLSTALRFEVPLFFAPEKPERRLDWRLTRTGDKLRLSVRNRGTRFARFSRLALSGRGGKSAAVKGPLYVLAGATRHWTLPENGTAPGGRTFTLSAESGNEENQHRLKVQ